MNPLGVAVMKATDKAAPYDLCTQPEQMRRILETTRLAIMVFDSTGNCVCASQAAMSLFGASEIQELRPLGSAGVSPPLQPDGTHSAEKWQQTLE
ncbi:PAS domain-containing protein, partial [Malikia spinosa]